MVTVKTWFVCTEDEDKSYYIEWCCVCLFVCVNQAITVK